MKRLITDFLDSREREDSKPVRYPEIKVGDKVRVRIRDRRKGGERGRASEYIDAGPPECTGMVVFVSDHWVTVDIGPYRVCAWKTDIIALYRDGRAVVVQPRAIGKNGGAGTE